MTGSMSNIVGVLLAKGYVLCLIVDLCVMLCNLPPTDLVEEWSYAL
jgi:hypothetical protein